MKIILASSSPRRIDLLKQVGLEFVVIKPESDEKSIRGETPRALVARLSKEKAMIVARRTGARLPKTLIIAADTIVVAPNGKTVLGKPRNTREAKRMLWQLSGRIHTVLTGFSLVATERGKPLAGVTRVVRSRVRMRKLSKKEIQRYVRSGEPMDKAGSYAAQGLGMALIEGIQGSYTNVVGLPMTELLMELQASFDIPLFSWRND